MPRHTIVPGRHGSQLNTEIDVDDFAALEGGGSTSAYSSPAMPSLFDLNSSASSSTTNVGTVSPQDLLIHEPFMSAPNSTTLTALTSPSVYNESPEFSDFDVSPNFGSSDLDPGASDHWYPLFPTETNAAESSADHSPAQKSEDLEIVEFSASSKPRKPTGSPPSGSGRHSAISGVSSRRRDKPLPPIVVEDASDVVAMKRARNTLAARKSRERKAQRVEDLEEKIARLEEERDHWKKMALERNS